MRYPDLSKSTKLTISGNVIDYTTENMLREWVFSKGDWSADEASIASFDRITDALKVRPFQLDLKDFERVCNILRAVTFPPHCSIELSHLRNAFVMAPTRPAKETTKK